MESQLPFISRDSYKTVDIIFVPDEAVEEIILTRKEYERQLIKKQKENEKERLKELTTEIPATPKGRKRKLEEPQTPVTPVEPPKKPKYDDDDIELALAALENIEVEKEPLRKPSTLHEEGDVSAGKIYTFEGKKNHTRSPLAKTAMINFANSTPKSKAIKPVMDKIEEEPASPQTPYSLRKRVIKDIKKIQKILENSDDEKDFSASESEYSGDSSEDEAEDNSDLDEDKKAIGRSYFEIPKSTKASSGRSLNSLSTPRLTREAVNKVFEQINIGEAHKSHISDLFRTHIALYEKWDFILRHNYNVLVYGVGSKRDLIEKYLSRFVKHHPVIKVNGFFPSITVKDVLDQICECLKLDLSGDALERIETKLEDYDIRIYVGINNIDGMMLRSKKNQQSLARLARLPQIRLVASVDHINAPLMWDQCLLTDFNWVWLDATTFLPYTDETSYEGSILLQSSGQQTLASLRSVFGSLTKNAQEIFLILANTQVAAEKGWQGMAFRELYQQGRRKALVSADSSLRLQLKEFIDHSVVKQRRTSEGEERYLISMDNSIVKQFLDAYQSTEGGL